MTSEAQLFADLHKKMPARRPRPKRVPEGARFFWGKPWIDPHGCTTWLPLCRAEDCIVIYWQMLKDPEDFVEGTDIAS